MTSDLERRLFEHNDSAQKGYAMRHRPWEVMHTESLEVKSGAMQTEKYFKSGQGREEIKQRVLVRYPPGAGMDPKAQYAGSLPA